MPLGVPAQSVHRIPTQTLSLSQINTFSEMNSILAEQEPASDSSDDSLR